MEVAERHRPSEWTVESRRSRYTIGYWFAFVLGMLGQVVPPAPDVIYTLKKAGSGETRTLRLPGDHSPADLENALARL